MVLTRKTSKLPPVSRRTVLGGLAAPLLPGSPATSTAGPVDPVLPLWAEWCQVSEAAAALAAHWSGLEARLVRDVGFPRVAVPAPDDGAPVWVTTHGDIDAFLAARNSPGLGPQLHAELENRMAVWRTAADRLGLDAADQRLDAADRCCDALAESLIRVRAGSLSGVIAKLELILRRGEARDGDDDFPWGWLRTAIADLRHVAVEIDPVKPA